MARAGQPVLWTASVLLCFVLVAFGMRCRVCKRRPPFYSCLDRELETCVVGPGGVCTKMVITEGGILKDQEEGCARHKTHCGKSKTTHNGITWNYTCCSGNMCNFWEFDPDF